MRKIQVLQADVLKTLDLSHRFVYLTEQPGRLWKDGLERRVRQACEALDIRRRGVHGFRATAACEFVNIKSALGYTEMEARHELATLAPHATACGAVQVCGSDTIRIARRSHMPMYRAISILTTNPES